MSATLILPETRFARLRRHFLMSRGGAIGLVLVTMLILAAILAPLLAPYAPNAQMREVILQSPSANHPLGTDDVGRDILSRLLFGARLSLSIGAVVVSLSFLIGTLLGLAAGFTGGMH
jgi:dipeptide transport system permease protein